MDSARTAPDVQIDWTAADRAIFDRRVITFRRVDDATVDLPAVGALKIRLNKRVHRAAMQ
jgi:hypothetical protein